MKKNNISNNHLADTSNLNSLQNFLSPMMVFLENASETVINEGVSKYPIILVSDVELSVGIPLLESEESCKKINVSSLEEFSTKNLISPEKVTSFISLYNTHKKNDICFFVLTNTIGQFVFLPKRKLN